MAVPDKKMEIADFKNFLSQQFQDSKEVNILLDQIVASKNAMEETFGKIPSFYGTMAKIITVNTKNGISDWINSDGQVNITQVNKAVQKVREVYEKQKQQAQQDSQKKENVTNEREQIEQQKADEIFKQIDFDKLTVDNTKYILSNFSKMLNSKAISEEDKKKSLSIMCEVMGADEFHRIVVEARVDPDILRDSKVQAIIAKHPDRNKYFDEKGLLIVAQADAYARQLETAIEKAESLPPEQYDRDNISKVFKEAGLDTKKESGCCNINTFIVNFQENNLKNIVIKVNKQPKNKFSVVEVIEKEMAENAQKNYQEAEKSVQDKMKTQGEAKIKKIIDVAVGIDDSVAVEDLQDDMESFFESMFDGAIDFAEMEEMGVPTLEGEGFSTFFEPSAQELEFQQIQAQQSVDELGYDELGDDGILGGEVVQNVQGEELGYDAMDKETLQDSVAQSEIEEEPRVPAGAFGIIGQLQNAAKEEPNDYTQGR